MGLFSRFFVWVLRTDRRTVSGHAFQKRLFRGLHRVGGSDMHPDAVEPEAEQPLLLVGAVEHFCQRKLAGGCGREKAARPFPCSLLDWPDHPSDFHFTHSAYRWRPLLAAA